MSQGVIRKVRFVSVVTPQMVLRIERNATVSWKPPVTRTSIHTYIQIWSQPSEVQASMRFECSASMRLCVSHYIQHSTVRRSAKLELEVRPIRSVSAAPGDLVLVEPPKSSERLILVRDHDAAMRCDGAVVLNPTSESSDSESLILVQLWYW
jgi:hypothetical protein